LSSIVGNWIGIITGDKKKWRLEKLFKEKELTVNHLHLKATSRTVLSGNRAAILIYLMILGSSAYLVPKQRNHKNKGHEIFLNYIKRKKYQHYNINGLISSMLKGGEMDFNGRWEEGIPCLVRRGRGGKNN